MVEAAKKFVCVMINCTNKSDETRKLQWKHGSRSYPTVIFLDPGAVFLDFMHFQSPEKTLERLKRFGNADYALWRRPDPVEFSLQPKTDVLLQGVRLQVDSIKLRQVRFQLDGKPWRRVLVIDENGRSATVYKEQGKLSISNLPKGFGTPTKIRVYPELTDPPKKQ